MNNIVKTFLDTKDPEFKYKPVNIAGDDLLLINPADMGTHWNETNQYFRSAIVNPVTYEMVSLGFLKFCNFGERPDFQPWDNSWKINAIHKLDGSLLIVSKYKGELICRTRGTVDARQLDNGHEIDVLIKKYPYVFKETALELCSFLYEWTTPNNIIVLREHEEPTLTLVGAIFNKEAQLFPQDTLDLIALGQGVGRPAKYEYNSVEECMADVLAWVGKEGVVLYSPDGQTLKKIKSDVYCELHKISTGLVTINNVLDLFMVSPKFSKYSDFYEYVKNTKDYEVAEKIKDHMLHISVAYSKALDQLERVKMVVDQVRTGFSRKEQAQQFQLHWKDGDWRLPVAFKVLDNQEIPEKSIRCGIDSHLA